MSTLPTPLRRQLENAITRARTVAEGGARKALEALAVHEPDAYAHMDDAQEDLRRKLRAQAKQLGDKESQSSRGAYDIGHLVEKLAYDQWHRLLFARFLLENNLLISPEHGVSVTLDDCEELAPGLGLRDAWAVAARFAARELPDIFRADDPAGAVELPVEDRNHLIHLVMGLPVEVYTASDSLGWCYQFWQAERKDEVNAAGIKIGADELPAVTQLFTEDYMVDFLLDNTLGAWHAAKVLAANPTLAESAKTEEELRNTVALPGCSWRYLRFMKAEEGKWSPAAGTFDGWPRFAKELKCLDPCMGSGHFIVAMFERLVVLRMAEEHSDEAVAVAAVIRDNLFGLEIDRRCTQIAAFNLALAAWRRVRHRKLPPMNLACSGLAPNTSETDWLALAGEDEKLRNGIERLYRLFKDAPVLGSLINPRAAEASLLVAPFDALQPLIEEVLAQENESDSTHEMAVTAQGLTKAAETLASNFTLIATNVPFLGRGNQGDVLRAYCERVYFEARNDLSTCFLKRCLEMCSEGRGSVAVVIPENWVSQASYKRYRENLLRDVTWNLIGRLGTKAFQTPLWDFNVQLLVLSQVLPRDGSSLHGLDVSSSNRAGEKSSSLRTCELRSASQMELKRGADARISFSDIGSHPALGRWFTALFGSSAGDRSRFVRNFWEVQIEGRDVWEFHQTTPSKTEPFGGREEIVLWEQERGQMYALAESVKHLNHKAQQWRSGKPNWGRRGVVVSLMANLPATLYTGEIYAAKCTAIVPTIEDEAFLSALWEFCSSGAFAASLRKINQRLAVEVKEVLQVPFDFAYWKEVAAAKYPDGLPKPLSTDPTQWLFDGHPKNSDQPLHVAAARLLGYRWPRQTGSSFPDCPALGPDGIDGFADGDGIVCLSATKGEEPAAERLRRLLVQALGDIDIGVLIASAGPKGSKCSTLEEWLRDEFFEQHCAIFQQRPFIWHIWDGHKSGFSALVNYHKLTHANLETLTYAYLGDWIRRQQAAVDAGEGGSDARLQAAKHLQARLKFILEGEPPYDIFVRWKPLSQQAIGWHPDLNDGLRLNIRPFLIEDIAGGKKGAGILRARPSIKWEKDRGSEPLRDKDEFPWFWGWNEEAIDFAGVGTEPDGNRWNDCHYTNDFKGKARERASRNE